MEALEHSLKVGQTSFDDLKATSRWVDKKHLSKQYGYANLSLTLQTDGKRWRVMRFNVPTMMGSERLARREFNRILKDWYRLYGKGHVPSRQDLA